MSGEKPEGGHGDGGQDVSSGQLTTWVVLGLAVVLLGALFGVRLEHRPDTSRDYPSRAMIEDGPATLLPAPEIDDEYLPCSDCHDDEPTNSDPRELEDEHDETMLSHGNLWCLHCHDEDDRDVLHLADGNPVAFEDSWQLCTQCHAKKLPDWRAGVHGKRTGYWRGPKEYRTCVVCHDPHAPAWKPIEPKPPPARPETITFERQPTAASGEASHVDPS